MQRIKPKLSNGATEILSVPNLRRILLFWDKINPNPFFFCLEEEEAAIILELKKKVTVMENEAANLKNLNKMLIERSKSESTRTSLPSNQDEANKIQLEKLNATNSALENQNTELLKRIDDLTEEMNKLRKNLMNSNEMIDSLNMNAFDSNQTITKLTLEAQNAQVDLDKSKRKHKIIKFNNFKYESRV